MKRFYFQVVDIDTGEIIKTEKSILVSDETDFEYYMKNMSNFVTGGKISGRRISDVYVEPLIMEEYISSTVIPGHDTVGFMMYLVDDYDPHIPLLKSSYEDVVCIEGDESKYVKSITEIIKMKRNGIFQKLNLSDRIPDIVKIQYFSERVGQWSDLIPIDISNNYRTKEKEDSNSVSNREPLKILIQGLDPKSQILVKHVSETSAEISINL